MCAKYQSMSATGREFHAGWCVVFAAPTGECASATGAAPKAPKPAPKARPGDHDGVACEQAHPDVGHVRHAIRAGKLASAQAPARRRSPRARRAQARANAAGLAANAKAAATVPTTPPVSAPRVTSGRVEPAYTATRVAGTPDVIAAAEAIVRDAQVRDERLDRMSAQLDDLFAALVSAGVLRAQA